MKLRPLSLSLFFPRPPFPQVDQTVAVIETDKASARRLSGGPSRGWEAERPSRPPILPPPSCSRAQASIDIRTPVAGTVSQVLVGVEEKVYELHPVAVIAGASSPRVRMKST